MKTQVDDYKAAADHITQEKVTLINQGAFKSLDDLIYNNKIALHNNYYNNERCMINKKLINLEQDCDLIFNCYWAGCFGQGQQDAHPANV